MQRVKWGKLAKWGQQRTTLRALKRSKCQVHSSKSPLEHKSGIVSMHRSVLSSSSSSEDETISVVAHQGSTQSFSSRSGNTRPASRSASARNSWRSSSSNSGYDNDGDTAPESTPGGLGANSFRSSSLDPTLPRKSQSAEHAATSAAIKAVQPLSLYGNDLLSITAIGSSEDENSVTWSDTLGAFDTANDFSIKDPHFDLTIAKMSTLFSLSNPNGTKSFLYSRKPDWATLRWINVERFNTLLIRRLQVLFKLKKRL